MRRVLVPNAERPRVGEVRVRRPQDWICERVDRVEGGRVWLVPYRRGMAKDGPRYKAIGNSMAVPLIRKLGERMASVDACVGREGGQEGAP